MSSCKQVFGPNHRGHPQAFPGGHDRDIPIAGQKPTVLTTPRLPYPEYTTENIALSERSRSVISSPLSCFVRAPLAARSIWVLNERPIPYDVCSACGR